MKNSIAHPVGKFLVTPLTRQTDGGLFSASVSVRRGMSDRIFRFIPQFKSDALAARYAMREGCNIALAG